MDENFADRIKIERPLYDHEKLRQDLSYQKTKKSVIQAHCSHQDLSVQKCLSNTIPSIRWLSHYKWKRDIMSDLISGFTVAVMHIPQGMAYALLGNVHPVVGIYMAFFPVLVYFFLGTSRHNSMGTFAVVCLMTGKTVLQYSKSSSSEDLGDIGIKKLIDEDYTPIQVATAVTFTVGIFQLIMYIFRLGAVSALLSETLVSGFTTGAAIQVVTSQIKDLFGLKIPKHIGYFEVINTLQSIFTEIGKTNFAALIISAVTILVVSLNNELLKPFLAKKTAFPVPIELIAVVIGTLVSNYFSLKETYNISVLGEIPSGLPAPVVPPFSLVSSVLLDGLTIAIVSYTVTLSMALIFAQKLNYEVDANQELLAMGSGNIFGSFFSCMPFCASLSRSSIQQTVGGKSQIASVVSCSILVVLLLWIGPLFEPLPKSVLAGVIVVSLKGMLMQVTSFFKYLKLSKMDALVWIVTFLTVVCVSIDIGLLIGIVMSLVTIFVLGFRPYTCLLGTVPGTDLYLDINRYKSTEQIPGMKIFHYSGGINFATRNIFKSDLLRLVGINPQKELSYRKKLLKCSQQCILQPNVEDKNNFEKLEKLQSKVNVHLRCIIIDFSSLSYIDPSGVGMLKSLIESFQKLDIPIYIASCSDNVYEMLKKCGLCNMAKAPVRIFSTVHDAVLSALNIFNIRSNATISRI